MTAAKVNVEAKVTLLGYWLTRNGYKASNVADCPTSVKMHAQFAQCTCL